MNRPEKLPEPPGGRPPSVIEDLLATRESAAHGGAPPGSRLPRRLRRSEHAQGEQRSLALALRLASHRVLTEIDGSPPLLLLDDVFSELDADRSAALLRSLPVGQTLLSAAVDLPDGVVADLVLDVGSGSVRPRQ